MLYYCIFFFLSGYRSPSTSMEPGAMPDPRMGPGFAAGTTAGSGFKELRRTPSTSAIYETLRRSKELRESLSSRPSSRLSIDNNMLASGARDTVRHCRILTKKNFPPKGILRSLQALTPHKKKLVPLEICRWSLKLFLGKDICQSVTAGSV